MQTAVLTGGKEEEAPTASKRIGLRDRRPRGRFQGFGNLFDTQREYDEGI